MLGRRTRGQDNRGLWRALVVRGKDGRGKTWVVTADQFTNALKITGADPDSRTSQAARLALVDGLAPHAAAKQIGVQPGNVYRAIAKLTAAIEAGVCPTCGRPM